MVRAVLVLGTVVGIVLLLAVLFLLDGRAERREAERKHAAPGELDAQRIALEAIRHLDQALVDPMYRQSTQWEDRARSLVDSYYGKGLKR